MTRMPIVAALAVTFLLPTLANTFSARSAEGTTTKVGAPKRVVNREPARIWEHLGAVLTMEITRAGDLLITGGAASNESVVVWDIKTGQRLLGLKGAGVVYSLTLSPDGKKIATAGYTGILEKDPKPRTAVWAADTGKELFAIKNKSGAGRPCIAFSPDGKLLATGTFTGKGDAAVGSVQLWHADTGKKAGEPLVGPSECFGRIIFSPDGKTLAAASWGAETFVVLWDVETRKQRSVLKIKKTWSLIRSVAFSSDSTRLAWASGNEVNGNAEHVLWDATTGKRIASLRTNAMMAWIAFDAKAETLLTVNLDGGFQRWNLSTVKSTSRFPNELAFPTMATSAALSPDGKTVVIGTGNSDVFAPPQPDNGAIRIFDAATGRERLAAEKEVQRAKDEAEEAARLAAGAKAQVQRQEAERRELAKLSPAVRAKIERASAVASHLRYALHLNQAQQAIERGHFAAGKALLEPFAPRQGHEDLRSFEWHYLWRQCRFEKIELEQQDTICASWQGDQPRLSSDGRTLAVATVEHEVNLWDVTTGKEGATLKMSGPIWHLAFSPDSKYVITAGGKDRQPLRTFPPTPEKDDPSSREALLWEVSSGKRLAKFDGSKIAVGCLAFAADSKTVAIADWQRTVRVFEVLSGKLTASLPLGAESANTLAFSRDGTNLAVGDLAGNVGVWDIATRREAKIYASKNNKPIISLQFDGPGKILYATEGNWSDNYIARRWSRKESDKWAQTREWKQVHRVALSPDGTRLVLSGWHGVVLWDEINDLEVARIVPRVSGDGLDSKFAFAPDSKTLLVHAHHIGGQPEYLLFDADSGSRLGAADNLLSGYDASIIHLDDAGKITAIAGDRKGRERMQVVLHTTLGQTARSRQFDEPRTLPRITSLAFSPDSQRLALTNGASLFVWHLRTEELQKIFQSNNQPIRTVRFSADGKAVLSSDPGGIKIWDGDTKKLRAHVKAHYGSFSADQKSVLVAKGSHTIAVFAARDGKPIGTMSPENAKPPAKDDDELARGDVVTSAAGKWAVGLGPFLFDAAGQKEIKRWVRDPIPLRFAFTPDEKTLVTTDRYGTMIVWDLPGVKERHVVPKGGVVLALSSNNRTSVFASDDGAIILFDLVSGTSVAGLNGLSASADQIAFSPDGKSLVTGSSDGTLRFWCPLTGAQRLGIRAHADSITSLAFSPDGAILATGGGQTVSLRFAR